jgi:hypothetical protein
MVKHIRTLAVDKNSSGFALAGKINGAISIYDLEKKFEFFEENVIKPLQSVNNDNAHISDFLVF